MRNYLLFNKQLADNIYAMGLLKYFSLHNIPSISNPSMFVRSVGYLLFSTSSMFPFIRFLSTLLFHCLLRPNGRIFLPGLTRQTLNKQMRLVPQID